MSESSIKLEPFTLASALSAQASLLWDWSYTGDGIAASGTFTTTIRPNADGYYQITGIAGVRNGEFITNLEPAGDAIPGNTGYPVDDLINASGQLTVNGFGYETADGNYANPYDANYLTPPTDQEVFTQPASGGFSEVPIDFKASVVPGVIIATVTPGGPADTLSLVVLQPPKSGTLSLDGNAVLYTPAGKNPVTPVNFSFDVTDQTGHATPVVTVMAGGSLSPAVAGAVSGSASLSPTSGDSPLVRGATENMINLGNTTQFVSNSQVESNDLNGTGISTISLSGGGNTVTSNNANNVVTLPANSNNTVTLGGGTYTVHGGTGDTINITGNTTLTIYGNNEMVFLGSGNDTVNDFSTSLNLHIGPKAGNDVLSNFASDPSGVVDLTGGIGGFTSVAAVRSALTGDGHGGTLLSFGHGSSLDFAGVASSQLHASNFQIG
jgi:hypothetical protein